MSVVVALSQGGEIHFGADSGAYSEDGATEIRKDPKIFVRGKMLIGAVGRPRIAQLVQYKLAIPVHKSGQDAFEYMVAQFVASLRTCLTENGATSHSEKSFMDEFDSDLIVGYRGRIFKIDENYAVSETQSPHDAVGTGAEPARAAFTQQDITLAAARRAKRELTYAPSQRVLDALNVAERMTNIVRRPFVTLTLKGKQ